MSWRTIAGSEVPTNRPVLVRTDASPDLIIAFLSTDGIWYSGGALVQNSSTLLGAAPTEWCEPKGDEQL